MASHQEGRGHAPEERVGGHRPYHHIVEARQKCCSYQMITHGWRLVNIRANNMMKDYLQF